MGAPALVAMAMCLSAFAWNISKGYIPLRGIFHARFVNNHGLRKAQGYRKKICLGINLIIGLDTWGGKKDKKFNIAKIPTYY